MNARNSILSLGLGALMVAAVGCGDDDDFKVPTTDESVEATPCVTEDAAGDVDGVMLSATTTTSSASEDVYTCVVVSFDKTSSTAAADLELPKGWTLGAAKELEGACEDLEIATVFAATSSTAGTEVSGQVTKTSTVDEGSIFLGTFSYELNLSVPNKVATSTNTYELKGSTTVDGETVCE